RIEDHLVGIEPMAGAGIVRTVHAIAVQLAGSDVRQVAVPHHVGVLRQRDALTRGRGRGRVEEAELYARRVCREDREVDAETCPGRTKRVRLTWQDAHGVWSASKQGPVKRGRGKMAEQTSITVIHPDGHSSTDIIPGEYDRTTLTHREPGAIGGRPN